MRFFLGLTALLTCLGSLASAQNMTGRASASLRVITFNDPLALLFESPLVTVPITEAVEFNVGPSGTLDLDVVPVTIDVRTQRIEVSYPTLDGIYDFEAASFNGYEITFISCVIFRNIAVTDAMGIAMDDTRVWSDPGRLYINVQSLAATNQSQFAVTYTLEPCPPRNPGRPISNG